MRREVWASGNKWRLIILHKRGGNSVEYCWGSFEKPVKYYLKTFRGNLSMTFESTAGSGTEKWHHDLSFEATKACLEKLRKSAVKAGFTRLGEY